MKIFRNILLLLAWQTALMGQNLVPNGDFETLTNCPTGFSQINLASPWMTPSGGSPDLYNTCVTTPGIGVPNNNWGHQPTHGGNGYAGIVIYQETITDNREYLEVALTNSLLANTCYKFDMYVNLGNYCTYTSNDIQVYFSNTIVSGILNDLVINLPFQLSYQANNFDSLSWIHVSGIYKATGGEKYILIGNFKDDMNSSIQPTPSWGQSNVYLYVDDVSLVQYLPCTVGLTERQTTESTIFPNPFSNELTLRLNSKTWAEFRLYDLARTLLIQESFEGELNLKTNGLEAGLYYYEVVESGLITGRGKLMKK